MQNVAKFRLIEGLLVPQPVRTNSAKYVHFFYLGPIRTNQPQRAFNKQKLPQMIFRVYLDANKHFHFKSRPSYTGLQ